MPRSATLRCRSRIGYLAAITGTIAVGLASRRFPDFVPALFGKYPGDVLWALMVFFGWGFCLPAASSARIASLALVVSYAVELLKLAQVSWLIDLRHTPLGHLVFGHGFSWQNFVAYTVGVALGLIGEHLFRPNCCREDCSGRPA